VSFDLTDTVTMQRRQIEEFQADVSALKRRA
jgi:hypothetical protein